MSRQLARMSGKIYVIETFSIDIDKKRYAQGTPRRIVVLQRLER